MSQLDTLDSNLTIDNKLEIDPLSESMLGGYYDISQQNALDPNPLIDNKLKIDPMRQSMLGGVNRSTVYRWIKTQGFPPPIKLSPSCSVWSVKQVNEWIESRKAFEAGEVA